MKHWKLVISTLLIILIATACQGATTATETLEPMLEPTSAPTATLEPSVAPTEIPTATMAPTKTPVIELAPQEAILDITWQWVDWPRRTASQS